MMNLLRKELSELMNKQMLISLVVSVLLIVMVGTLASSAITEEMGASGTLHVIDEDQTAFTQTLMEELQEIGYTVETGDDFETMEQTAGWSEAVVLPAGMSEAFEKHERVEIPVYTSLTSTSMVKLTMSGSGSAQAVEAVLKKQLSEQYLGEELEFLNNPVIHKPYTRANGRTVEADAVTVASSVAMFDQFMPLVLFLLVVLTAQTIITAICSEKLDKTLETLLSSPVPRSKIIGAKMLAALIVAVVYAAVYGLGFVIAAMMNTDSLTANMEVGTAFADMVKTRSVVQELGLQIPGYGWVGVILQLCLTLGIALTASIILGALTEDAKNAQSASLPIMICTMFPYILSMVSDIRGMEGAFRWLVLAIPFTHTFTATGCLRFQDYGLFWGGLIYQAVFLAAMVWLALKLYSSDILFVHSRKYRKKQQTAEE